MFSIQLFSERLKNMTFSQVSWYLPIIPACGNLVMNMGIRYGRQTDRQTDKVSYVLGKAANDLRDSTCHTSLRKCVPS